MMPLRRITTFKEPPLYITDLTRLPSSVYPEIVPEFEARTDLNDALIIYADDWTVAALE